MQFVRHDGNGSTAKSCFRRHSQFARLDEVFITVNKNAIPNDPQKPFVTSGIRVGTPAVTTRGLQPADMDTIAQAMYLAASDFENKAEEIRESVCELCEKYPLYE